MKNILIDTNVALDFLLYRGGYKTAAELLSLIKDNILSGWLSAHSIDTLHYILNKKYSNSETKELLKKFLNGFIILPTRNSSIDFNSKIIDFEDSIVEKGAYQFNLDAIITRNIKDFKNSRIPVFTPEEYLDTLSKSFSTSFSLHQKIPFLDLKAQFKDVYNEIDDEITNVISNTAFIKGKSVEKFEKQFAEKLGVKYCIGVGNGTDALVIALKSLGIDNGDEVITAANSFIATSEAITAVGAKVVFVDVNPRTYNIDVSKIEKKITPKTKAIIPVHLYGQPADMKPILDIAKQYNLFVVEDAAQAHFAEYNLDGKWYFAGTMGDVATFSFYPGKNLGAYGDAGAVVTNNEEIARKARMFANHGRISKYNHEFEGYNSRLDTIQAAVLNIKLKYISEWTKKKREVANLYSDLLKGVGDIIIPFVPNYAKPVWHLYVIRTKYRDELKNFLSEKGVATGIHYPIALPNLKAYSYLGYKKEDFPVSSKYQDEILSLPMFSELEKVGIDYVVKKIRDFYQKY